MIRDRSMAAVLRAALPLLLLLGGCAPPARPTNPPPRPVPPPPPPPPSDGGGTLRWEFPTPGGLPLSAVLDAAGRPFLYVAQKEGGLLVLRLAGSARPTQAARIERARLGGLHASALAQQGNYLYLGLGDFFAAGGSKAGLAIVDVSNPAAPALVSTWISPETMNGVVKVLASGPTVYLGAKANGLLVFDVSNPAAITKVGEVLPDPNYPKPNPNRIERPNTRGLALAGTRLYVANDAGGFRVIDVANRAAPREIARYVNPAVANKPRAYNNVVVSGTTAYVAVDYCGLEILNVADPAAIRQIGWWNPWGCDTPANNWFNSPGQTNELVLDETRHLVHMSAGGSELVVVDVSDPARPVQRGQYRSPNANQGAWGLAVGPNETYLTYITSLVPFRGTWAGVRAVSTFR